MAPCRVLCGLTLLGMVGLVVTVALLLGKGGAEIEEVDKAAIAKAGRVRIQQGGLVNFTGIEVNTGDGVLQWHIGTVVTVVVGLGLALAAACWLKRKCKRGNDTPQDIELGIVPNQQPDLQPYLEDNLEDEEVAQGLPGSHKDLETEAERHPVMLALMGSLED
jgi:hypothetical protein